MTWAARQDADELRKLRIENEELKKQTEWCLNRCAELVVERDNLTKQVAGLQAYCGPLRKKLKRTINKCNRQKDRIFELHLENVKLQSEKRALERATIAMSLESAIAKHDLARERAEELRPQARDWEYIELMKERDRMFWKGRQW